MARVRYIGPEPVSVPELGEGRVVQLDEVVTVPTDRFEGYVCQPSTWESVEEPRDEPEPRPDPEAPRAVLPKRSLAKSQQKEV
jgi:hypothetical protein